MLDTGGQRARAIVVTDSSGLIAALNHGGPEHAAAAEALDAAGYVVVSPLALVEIDYVIARYSVEAEQYGSLPTE